MCPSRRDFLRTGETIAGWRLIGGPAAPANFLQRDITSDDVRKAIERAKNFLRQQQQKDGTWPNQPNYADGLTPLCTLALLTAGSRPSDEEIQKSLAYLRTYRANSTYTISLQTMVLCMAEPECDRNLIRRNVTWLDGRQVRQGREKGMWAIPSPGSTDHIDNSMTHFAMLALYEAECLGISVSEQTWRLALNYWHNNQNADGSWGWSHDYEGTGSMTCAGIAAIIIASGVIGTADARVEGDRVICCCEQESSPHIDKATQWMERHFSIFRNPGYKYWHSYYLYSLERMGRLTARRFLGKHDWYREGARALLDSQLLSGAWPPDAQFDRRKDPNVSTALSLMFLAKGQRPILLAHLKHAPLNDWNRHRNAMANLLIAVEKAWQRPLAYQVIDIRHASVEDLLESPVLFLNGRESPDLADDEARKLRMYVDRGGFIFAEQCCGSGGFDQGFRALVARIFPEEQSQLRLLPADHPAWYAETPVGPNHLRQLWGVDVGCRTGVIYCPEDLSCYWEVARLGREQSYSPAVQEQIQAARAIGLNVLAYATGRELRFKNPAPVPVQRRTKPQRGRISVANVIHPGGCDAAPSSLRNLLRLFAERSGAANVAEPGSVRLTDEELFEYHLVCLHGRSQFELTSAERKQLRTYLERGGMIFADAICSSKEFANSLRRELSLVLPEIPWKPIPASDPLFTPTYGGNSLAIVALRTIEKTQAERPPSPVVRRGPPVLEGLTIAGRYVVIFSPYDISCSLDGHSVPNCEGYAVADALKIALNVLLYSCQ